MRCGVLRVVRYGCREWCPLDIQPRAASISAPLQFRIPGKTLTRSSFPVVSGMAESVDGKSASGVSSQSAAADGDRPLRRFALPSLSALVIQKGDITKWFVDGYSDAIVNPANERMLGGLGADGAIHGAAGEDLVAACRKVPEVRPGIRCPTGEARITPNCDLFQIVQGEARGFKLPASHVIHTVGPIYHKDNNPEVFLGSAYRNSLKIARENGIQFIAFPAISCGVFGYPFNEAAMVAISTVRGSANGLKEVHFVLFLDEIYDAWVAAADGLLKA